MKKVLFLAAALCLGIAASAQFTVGLSGSFAFPGHSSNSEKTTFTSEDLGTELESSTSSYCVSPKIGYKFNDAMSAGLAFTYKSSNFKSVTVNYKPEGSIFTAETNNNITSTYGFTPYFRYNFVSYGSLALFVEAQVNIEMGSVHTEKSYRDNPELGVNDNYAKSSIMAYGITIVPGITYEVTDHITLDVYMNYVALGYNSVTKSTSREADTDLAKERKETYTMIGFNNNSFYDTQTASTYNLGTVLGVALNVTF